MQNSAEFCQKKKSEPAMFVSFPKMERPYGGSKLRPARNLAGSFK
jgi:hypothetical protein